jgi:hypothetical protein
VKRDLVMSLNNLDNINGDKNFKIIGGIIDDAFMLLHLIYFEVWF